MTTRHGNAWVGKVYLMRHRQHGVQYDCAYAEPPTQEEFREVCELRGFPYAPELLIVTELPLVSDIEGKVERLDDWAPPPPPPAPVPVNVNFSAATPNSKGADATKLGGKVGWKVSMSGSGVIRNPRDPNGAVN